MKSLPCALCDAAMSVPDGTDSEYGLCWADPTGATSCATTARAGRWLALTASRQAHGASGLPWRTGSEAELLRGRLRTAFLGCCRMRESTCRAARRGRGWTSGLGRRWSISGRSGELDRVGSCDGRPPTDRLPVVPRREPASACPTGGSAHDPG